MRKLLIPALILAILAGCGGGQVIAPSQDPMPPIASTINLNLNSAPSEIIAKINLNTASLYLGSDKLFYNLLGKGDINGDGYDDLVIGLFRHTTTPSYSGRQLDPSGEIKPVVLFYDTVNDTYIVNTQLQSVIRKNQHPRQVAIADFDGDGRNDVFIADHGYDDAPYGNQNTLLLNKVNGFIDGTDMLPQYADFSHGLVVADFDNNSKPDLLILNNRTEAQTKCEKYSGFTDCHYTSPKLSESYVLFNNGLGGLTKGALNIPDSVINFTTTSADPNKRLYVGHGADFNSDGWTDLVVSNHRDIFIMESKGSVGQFSSAQVIKPPAALSSCTYTPASAITSLDLDDDKVDEIIASFACDLHAAYFKIYKRNIHGIWEDKTNSFLPDQTANTNIVNDGWCYKFEIADINADGKKDIICQSTRGQGKGSNNIFWISLNGKLVSADVILQNGNWFAFETMVKTKNGTGILGFNHQMGHSDLVIKRWKN